MESWNGFKLLNEMRLGSGWYSRIAFRSDSRSGVGVVGVFIIFRMSWLKADGEIPTSCLRDVARLLRGQVTSCLASFRRGHCASKSGARQVALRVVLTDVRRHCCCECPAIAGTLRGYDVRHFTGFLAR